MKLDLHCHSTASDGVIKPAELIKKAGNLDLDFLSLTDHDTTEGVKEILASPLPDKPFFIPGIELSTVFLEKEIHILGYFTDRTFLDPQFDDVLYRNRMKRGLRSLEIIRRLKEYYNIVLDTDKLNDPAASSIGRPHIARMIQEKYGVPFEDVFKKYIGKHTKAYVPNERIELTDGIRLLKEVNAVVILAHPGDYGLSLKVFENTGLDGIECYYPSHSKEETREFIQYSLENGLYITCGSDDHGNLKDTRHGSLGKVKFNEEELERFIERFTLKKA